ncbi:MAG: O-acetylhomoserine aminocarboxypropyltransferase/cysteine synthase [Lachnospiraceae bacterium]|nr:O-acetylhomoserine aminocarboxypropyltransferase/cysteine synthase [Lachnospiraceae bacterium]
MSSYNTETICVQGGYKPGNGEPRQIPIIQSTTFKYDTGADMGALVALEASGYFYTRLQNPTNDMVAAKIAALEGGTAGMLTSSGQAANFFALFNICQCGDHIVSSSSIYGGTFNLISVTMAKMGIEVTFVPSGCTEEELDAAFRPNTKALFGETIANPALTVLDIELFARVAHKHGVPLIVDNTFATPVNCRPIEWGADIVTHSTTKYMDGHGTAVGGAIVDGGKFDWMAHKEKYPGLTTPDESYHGITYAEKFGLGGAFITKCTAQLMRDFGSIQSPQHAFYLNLGLESLHVRMAKHCENGQAVAEFLQGQPQVRNVSYCGLPGDPYHELAKKYLPKGSCGVVSFEIRGGRAAAEKFMNSLKLIAIETHVADARSCCLNPATTTHRQMTEEQLAAAGIPAGLIRVSCGLEAAEDLVADLRQALGQL